MTEGWSLWKTANKLSNASAYLYVNNTIATCPLTRLSVCPLVRLPVCSPTSLPVHLSTSLPRLSDYLSVCSALLHANSLLQSSTQAHSNRTDDDDDDDDYTHSDNNNKAS